MSAPEGPDPAAKIGVPTGNDMKRFVLLTLGGVLFGALVLLNTGGYRYGVSDQAFYIPIVLHQLSPELYPYDAALIAAQDRFFAFDDWFAPILTATGISLSTGFLLAYAVTLVLLYGAIVTIGGTLYATWWGVAGLVVGLTMRHRIPDTAVNTLEGYFHPRLLAFALGLWAVATFLRGRTWPALSVTMLALCVHPTTGLWFAVLVGAAAFSADRDRRPWLGTAAGAASAAGAWALAGPLNRDLVVMDPTWISVLSVKDYLYAAEWPMLTWFGNLAMTAVIGGAYWYRRRLGIASRRETGLVIGCAVLLGLFLISVPLASAHIALAVQLQVNRVFWLFDILGSCYAGWLLIERPWWTRASAAWLRATPRPVVVAIVLLLALSRGGYVTFVDRAGQPIVEDAATVTDWETVMRWASAQPVGTHFLADPNHAILYGTSVRVASGRDVYLEVVRDTGIAIYSAAVAHRVSRRIAELGDFDALTEDHALSLADRYHLDFLITEHELSLPETQSAGRLHVYALDKHDRLAASGAPGSMPRKTASSRTAIPQIADFLLPLVRS